MPERGNPVDGVGGSIGQRGDEAGTVPEEFGLGMVHAALLGSGHRVGADEEGPVGQGGCAQPADLCFHAPDVGDEGGRGQGVADLADERHNAVDRRADNDEIGSLDRFDRGGADLVAPGRLREIESGLGSPGPDFDPAGGVVEPGGLGDGCAEQTGGEDREGGRIHPEREETGSDGAVESFAAGWDSPGLWGGRGIGIRFGNPAGPVDSARLSGERSLIREF